MKISKIRINGSMPTDQTISALMINLIEELRNVGFITDATQKTSTCIKLGLRMRSFSIDIEKMPHNIQYNPFRPQGKLTNLPTWNQRVEYNNIVNRVLTALGISAKVTSGEYLVRDGEMELTESDWNDQQPDWMAQNESRGHYVDVPNDRSIELFQKRTLTTVSSIIASRR